MGFEEHDQETKGTKRGQRTRSFRAPREWVVAKMEERWNHKNRCQRVAHWSIWWQNSVCLGDDRTCRPSSRSTSAVASRYICNAHYLIFRDLLTCLLWVLPQPPYLNCSSSKAFLDCLMPVICFSSQSVSPSDILFILLVWLHLLSVYPLECKLHRNRDYYLCPVTQNSAWNIVGTQ